MNVNDIVKQVATFLQLSNVQDANLDNFDNLDAQCKRDINLIISCMNEVLSDIATDYLPLVCSEQIEVTNKKYDLKSLENSFYKLLKVKTNQPYTIDFETLKIANGIYELDYLYLPEEYELDDDIEEFDSRLTIYALCYGIAAEYCLISGNYNESELWNSRFENAMNVATSHRTLFSLKQRRWI